MTSTNNNSNHKTTDAANTGLRLHAGRMLVSVCLTGGMLLTCSCLGGVGGRTASRDPFLQPTDAASPDSTSPVQNIPADQAPVRVAELPQPMNAPATRTDSDAIEQVAYSQPKQVGVVRLAEWQSPSQSMDSQRRVEPAIYSTPTVARTEITPAAYHVDAAPPKAEYNISDIDEHTDEYLLDGGDRALPIHFDRFHRLGVDTEDTIAEYSDHLGNRHVKPTNRVAVYAPRFGAVRTVTGPGAGTAVELFALSSDTSGTAGLKNRRTPLNRTQRDAINRIDVRSRPSGVESGANRRGVSQSTALLLNVKPVKAAEDLSFVGSGRFLQTERARIAAGIQAAAVWSRTQSPVIIAQDDGLQEAYAAFKPQELVGLDDEHLKKGELRIVKLADRKTAKPGDVITFTIRYDNLGDRELNHIRIIDNLTPRLEYVEDSATSDRAGRLDTEDNGEGSLVLKFIVDRPLPGHKGGVVTFKALVR
ncbi:MAG: DUF11 domain-containing protein [Planctomycetaceae bacterium]|nr:DUF11 domain-containing protein [Planctomycetaceae bacterium]MBT6153321.1 DUF11 domain-containing protein [Planctomycetaceae bacterium]MBT6486245.1 DUF11 domain-containing protein [Planctomycetaceae bacterium]MBT6495790.1 DUF11 domain-containing protein [Planctomycetaceae bacterium]